MKRFLALVLSFCMMMTLVPAIAESTTEDAEETSGVATNPYDSTLLGQTIELPDDIQVTDESETDNGVVLTLQQDGHSEIGYTISITQNESYAGYTMANLPDEMKQEMIDYYSANYTSDSNLAFPELTEDMDALEQYFSPFTVFGTGADGNYYAIYICILNTFVLTVSGGVNISETGEADENFFGKVFNLYWQSVDMFYNFLDSTGMFDE